MDYKTFLDLVIAFESKESLESLQVSKMTFICFICTCVKEPYSSFNIYSISLESLTWIIVAT
jgi:hypothetical protein